MSLRGRLMDKNKVYFGVEGIETALPPQREINAGRLEKGRLL
jgi:hypothetical protein